MSHPFLPGVVLPLREHLVSVVLKGANRNIAYFWGSPTKVTHPFVAFWSMQSGWAFWSQKREAATHSAIIPRLLGLLQRFCLALGIQVASLYSLNTKNKAKARAAQKPRNAGLTCINRSMPPFLFRQNKFKPGRTQSTCFPAGVVAHLPSTKASGSNPQTSNQNHQRKVA